MEAGVETLEGFGVMEPQDRSAQQGEDLAAAGFLARPRGVFFPQTRVAFPMVLVLHGPMPANGLREPDGAPLVSLEAGDEVAGVAFDLVAFSLHPFAGAADELPRTGKEADVPVEIDSREAAAFDSAVAFFPVTDPFVEDGGGEFGLGELVEGGLVVLES